MTRLAPFQRHSETSREAAIAIHGHKETQKERVFEAIRRHGPISDQGLAKLLGLPENSVRPRRVDLLKDGAIERCGEGRTVRDRRCVLYQAVSGQGRLL